MQIPRVYFEGEIMLDAKLVLSKQASSHLVRVLRHAEGDILKVFNGNGVEYTAKIITANKNATEVVILEQERLNNESPLHIHLGQGISRGDRMDYVIQKAVELGANRITPIFTERCEVKLRGDRLEKRLQHWQAVAIAACEQSGRCIIPTLNDVISLKAWLGQPHKNGIVCDPNSNQILQANAIANNTSILIGPEGGLSEREIELASTFGFQPIMLGPRILRTETATVVALALVQGLAGDLVA